MKYAVVTFGCRVNQADSFGFEEGLRACGALSAPVEGADLVVVNTCSVTATADQGARQTIRRIARVNPAARIVVTGCYATRRPDEIRDLPNVAQVVSNDDKPRLLQLTHTLRVELAGRVRPDLDGLSTAERFGSGEGSCGASIEPGVAGRTAFTLRVQTGCDEACTYCIIPTTRGRARSLPLQNVLAETDRAFAAGFREIALTGVHLGSYGRDLSPVLSLGDMLRALAAGETRRAGLLFRLSSLEPMDCSPEIVDLVRRHACFAPHFHLPMQHASDRVLRAMRRPYTMRYFADLAADIRLRLPHAAIGSDVIVGFPGESAGDFEQVLQYLEESPLTHVHVFPYSDRPGTAASTRGGKVAGAVVRDRARLVREIGQRLTARFRDAQIGTTRSGLTIEDGSTVITDNFLKLRIPPGLARNERVRVRVMSHHDGELLTG
jgi:threonylcarbamoyladenosine tRNA methylthiotransferase MtaB